jgi:CarD family transcriptional regulator
MQDNRAIAKYFFKVDDTVVYPSHGVGVITAEETQVVAGLEVKFLVITFAKDRMTLRVPVNRAQKAGLRHLSSPSDIQKALVTLKGKARIEKGMWSKRAQKYEEKIHSGDVISIAEVLRDLHRNIDDPARSYSERLIYEAAFDRFVNEYAVTNNISVEEAKGAVKAMLSHTIGEEEAA